jgi:hypothetical protein
MYLKTLLLFIQSIFFLTLEQDDDHLPVELYYFNAEIISNYVLLTWGTATEVDNYGFNVERSLNLNDWMTLEFLPGFGTSNIPRDYAYEDTSIIAGSIYFYRLKQIDIVGSFAYSDTLTVPYLTDLREIDGFTEQKNFLFQSYPNPFNSLTKIKFMIATEGLTKLLIFDVTGGEITELVNENLKPGTYEVEFNSNIFPTLSSGIYFCKIISNNFLETKKLILLK